MTGIGKVFKGSEFVADVRYDYLVTPHFDEGMTLDGPYRVQTASSVHLRIVPPLPASSDVMTLQMSDGKKQDFYVRSADGLCLGTGGPY